MTARKAWLAKEVAESTGLPYENVLRLIRNKKLRAVKSGRYYLVPVDALDEYLSGKSA